MHNQYIVTAKYSDGEMNVMKVMLVSDDEKTARGYDVSAYRGTKWNVFCEHFIIDDMCRVVECKNTYILYPNIL